MEISFFIILASHHRTQCLGSRKFLQVLVKTIDQQQFVTEICRGRDRTALAESKYKTRYLLTVMGIMMLMLMIFTE